MNSPVSRARTLSATASQNTLPGGCASTNAAGGSCNENEIGVIGAILIDGSPALEIAQEVGVIIDCFENPAPKATFVACLTMARDGQPIDLLTVTQHLRASGVLDSIGGPAAIDGMVDATPTTAHLKFHAEQVLTAYRHRKASSLARSFLDGGCDIGALAASFQRLTVPGRAGADGFPQIVKADTFADVTIEAPSEVVVGVLHAGSKLVFGGPSKAFKSWTLLDLCLSVAGGVPWLGFATHLGRVLYINLELQAFALQRRLRAIATAKRLEIPHNLAVWNLRGRSCPLSDLLPELLRQINGEVYSLIVVDPIYKTLDGRDENAAGDIGQLCNELEALAVQSGAAVAFGAHFAKGNASAKASIDRVSGSGVFARDPDSIIIATPHENECSFAVEMTLRNFQPQPPFVMTWQFPLMHRDDELDPTRLLQPQRQAKTAPARPDVSESLNASLALVNAKPLAVTVFKNKLYRLVSTQSRVRELYAMLVSDGHLTEFHDRGRGHHAAWVGLPAQIDKLRQSTFDA